MLFRVNIPGYNLWGSLTKTSAGDPNVVGFERYTVCYVTHFTVGYKGSAKVTTHEVTTMYPT